MTIGDQPSRRCLVTGGAGFIGSHLVDHLVAQGAHITVVDDLSTGSVDNLQSSVHASNGRLTVIEDAVQTALPKLNPDDFDEVYHLAASVGVGKVMADPASSIENNIGPTAQVIRFACGASSPLPTLIASSSEVYGKSTQTPFREDGDCVYGPTTAIRWSYAASKAIDEYLALAAHRTQQLPVVIARFFNTVGPRQVGHYGMVVPRFISAALNGDALPVYGNGSQSRCFCDVRDLAPALPTMLAEPACYGGVFNLGSDQPISITQLAELVIETLASDSQITHIAYEDVFGPGFEDPHARVPDLSRISNTIGFRAVVPLAQTIRDVAALLQPH